MAETGLQVPRPGLWKNRNFRLFWTGQSISMLGDAVFDTTVVLWVATRIAAGQTWAPLAVGGVLAAALVPVVLVGPFAGVFVDRWDRRRTMIVTDLIRAVLILGLLILPAIEDSLSRTAQLTILYVVVAMVASASQFFNGSRFGLIALVVPPDDQPRASGAVQSSAALAGIIGPPLAAPLLFAAGVGWSLVINAGSFLASLVTVASMRGISSSEAVGGATREGSFWREFRAGVRFFAGNSVLRALLISVMVVTVGVGAVNALDVFFVIDNLHADASNLGILGAAISIGSLVGALLATAIGNRVRPQSTFWTMLIVMGVAVVAYARSTSLVPAAIVLGIVGLPLGLLNASGGPLLMQSTPQALLGRVMSVFNPFQQVAGIAGMLVATYLASNQLRDFNATALGLHFGRIDTMFVVAGVLFIGAGLWVAVPLSKFVPLHQAVDPVAEAEIQPLIPESVAGAPAPRAPVDESVPDQG